MNKKTSWILVLVLAIVVVIVAALWMNAKPAKAPEMGQTSNPNPTSTTDTGISTATSTSSSSIKVMMGGGSYKNDDFSFDYPAGWTISNTKPLMLTTFGGKYATGGSIPAGGAEMDIAITATYGNLQSIMQTELATAQNTAMSVAAVDGVSCAKAVYDTSVGGVALKDAAIYCEKGNKLWKIYFSHRADDSTANGHVNDFASIMSSLKLL